MKPKSTPGKGCTDLQIHVHITVSLPSFKKKDTSKRAFHFLKQLQSGELLACPPRSADAKLVNSINGINDIGNRLHVFSISAHYNVILVAGSLQ